MRIKCFRSIIRWGLLFGMQSVLFLGNPSCLDPANEWQVNPGHVVKASQNELKVTTIAACLGERIQADRNLIWCGTFQLAWNECMKLVGEPLRFEPSVPLADELNRKEFTLASVDERNCVA